MCKRLLMKLELYKTGRSSSSKKLVYGKTIIRREMFGEKKFREKCFCVVIITRNAMRSNNRDDLFHLNFTLKTSILSKPYMQTTRTSMMEPLLRKY